MLRRLTRLYRLTQQHDLLSAGDLRAAFSREQQKHASKLPSEYQQYYKSQNLSPKARPRVQDAEPQSAAASSAQEGQAASSTQLGSATASQSTQSAQAGKC